MFHRQIGEHFCTLYIGKQGFRRIFLHQWHMLVSRGMKQNMRLKMLKYISHASLVAYVANHHLVQMYIESVGRNCNFIIGGTENTLVFLAKQRSISVCFSEGLRSESAKMSRRT